MSYHGSPTATNTDGIRILVGDISTSTGYEFLGDEAYTFFLAQSSQNVYLAAQLACQALASLFATTAQERKIGDLMLKRGDMVVGYTAMAKQFAGQALALISPSAGGISRADKRDAELDTDRVVPAFRRRLFDSYRAMNPASSVPGSTFVSIVGS